MKSFWGGTKHYGATSGNCSSSHADEFIDSDDAAEWLEDNGYDPDGFDV